MKTKKEISELLEKLINQDINQEEKSAIEGMINENSAIREEYLVRKRIDQAIRNTDVIRLRAKLKKLMQNNEEDNKLEEPKVPYFKWYHVAATIVILIGISLVFHNYYKLEKTQLSEFQETENSTNRNKDIQNFEISPSPIEESRTNDDLIHLNTQNQEQDQNEKIEIHQQETLYASNFEESAYFESYIDNFRSESVVIISPQPDESYPKGAEINFRWVRNVNDSIMIRIFNNTEGNICSVYAIQDFKLDLSLAPGLYYWKLETENDLLYMNKFFVR